MMKPNQVQLALWRRTILAALRVKVRLSDVNAVTSGAPMILTCNHQSLLDGLILAFACPTKMVFPVTPKHSVDNLFTSCGLRLLEWLGLGWVVPMNSNHPYALRRLQRALEAGRSVAVFPEGRIARPDEQLPHKAGVQWLQERTGAPVVRARLTGADQSRLFAFWGEFSATDHFGDRGRITAVRAERSERGKGVVVLVKSSGCARHRDLRL